VSDNRAGHSIVPLFLIPFQEKLYLSNYKRFVHNAVLHHPWNYICWKFSPTITFIVGTIWYHNMSSYFWTVKSPSIKKVLPICYSTFLH